MDNRLLPPDLEKGLYCIIEDDVKIGSGCKLGHHVIIHKGCSIGDNVRIDDFAVIGVQPMHRPGSKVTENKIQPGSIIGSGCLIGIRATVYAGAELDNGVMVADSASVREEVTVGENTVIGRLVTVENKTTIGRDCKIETSAYICAFSQIGDGCFVAPCVVTSNDNTLGKGKNRENSYRGLIMRKNAAAGAGAVFLPGKIIGQQALAGAGAVVTRDIEDGQIKVGNPAVLHEK